MTAPARLDPKPEAARTSSTLHRYAAAIRSAELTRRSGSVSHFFGLVVESNGPDVFLGEVCEIRSRSAVGSRSCRTRRCSGSTPTSTEAGSMPATRQSSRWSIRPATRGWVAYPA